MANVHIVKGRKFKVRQTRKVKFNTDNVFRIVILNKEKKN